VVVNIVVKKLTDKVGCAFNDRVTVEFTPGELEALYNRFKGLALDTSSYDDQGWLRKMVERFESAHRMWRETRDKRDKR
jgi:hypothetical protein